MSLVRFEKVWRLIGADGLILAQGSWDEMREEIRLQREVNG